MGALWRRRTIRHMLVGLLPLLVVGPAVTAVLALRFFDTAGPVREATARAVATVQRTGLGPDGREVELSWTDERGTRRTSTVRAERAGEVPVGSEVELRHRPADPGRVFVGGDETSVRLRDLAYGLLLTSFVVAAVVLVTAVHVARRLAAERRGGSTLPVTYARSRRGVLRRSWLVVAEQGREWWVPVHWEPHLPRVLAGTPATVRGRPSRDRVVVVDVEGIPVWQAVGRRRSGPPRGETLREAPPWSASAQRRRESDGGLVRDRAVTDGGTVTDGTAADDGPATRTAPPVGLARQFRTDSALLVAAPLIGLMWAYVDGGGAASWLVAAALAAAVLFWLPTVAGSDPS